MQTDRVQGLLWLPENPQAGRGRQELVVEGASFYTSTGPLGREKAREDSVDKNIFQVWCELQ